MAGALCATSVKGEPKSIVNSRLECIASAGAGRGSAVPLVGGADAEKLDLIAKLGEVAKRVS